MRNRAHGQSAFTLIELMIVVAIIGILASVAIPAFMRNSRKAKSTEATISVKKLYDGSRSYVFELSARRAQIDPIASQFPEPEVATPAVSCCAYPGRKCSPNPLLWMGTTWQSLKFEVTDPHYYQYEYPSTGSGGAGPGSAFTARALGDLDCDGVLATFEMTGQLSSVDYDVHGSGGIFMSNPTE